METMTEIHIIPSVCLNNGNVDLIVQFSKLFDLFVLVLRIVQSVEYARQSNLP